jgi:hypothetical protein
VAILETRDEVADVVIVGIGGETAVEGRRVPLASPANTVIAGTCAYRDATASAGPVDDVQVIGAVGTQVDMTAARAAVAAKQADRWKQVIN